MRRYRKRFKNNNENKIVIPELRINQDIKSDKIRLIDQEGMMIGVVTPLEGLNYALSAELDLVEVGPKADPPICKVINYDKYRYAQIKKLKEEKTKQHQVEVKSIRLTSFQISDNDLEIKVNNARKFLEKNKLVKFTMQLKGREIAHKEAGIELMKSIAEKLEDIAVFEKAIQADGDRRASMVLKHK